MNFCSVFKRWQQEIRTTHLVVISATIAVHGQPFIAHQGEVIHSGGGVALHVTGTSVSGRDVEVILTSILANFQSRARLTGTPRDLSYTGSEPESYGMSTRHCF